MSTLAGLPSLHHIKSTGQILRMIYFWIILTVIFTTISKLGIWLTASAMLFTFTQMLLTRKEEFHPEYYFRRLNFYMLLVVILIILDRPVILNLSS
ncbi:MAG: hypothetical protein ISS19_08960 [Bacteroidales bacterium]|nr:hypothetical protein [Bacteroidales bacterium]